MSASSVWSGSERDFPVHGPPHQKLGHALKHAMLASSETQWQSWQFRLTDTSIELIAQADPAQEAIDPDRRELLIGCGAALVYLKLTLKHFGCLGRVELFPDLDQPTLAARIHFGFCRERDSGEKLAFEAMAGSRTGDLRLGEPPISEATCNALHSAVVGERGWLEFAQSENSRQRLVEIIQTKEQRGTNLNASRIQSANFSAMGGPFSRWSKPLFAFGGRSVSAAKVTLASERPLAIPAATLAVVKTKTDDKHGWTAAGQTMARAVLQAQALGLSWSFFSRVRIREAREALRTGIGHKGFAQVILRIGSLAPGESFQRAASATATATFR